MPPVHVFACLTYTLFQKGARVGLTLTDTETEPTDVDTDVGWRRRECSGEAGFLAFKEIMTGKRRWNEQQYLYDEASGVKYVLCR